MPCLRFGPGSLAHARPARRRAACTTSASAIKDTLQWVGAARRGIPFRTAWKRQQLVMQGISRGKACSCQPSLKAGAKLEGRQIIPSSPPASLRCQEPRGRQSLQSLSTTIFQLPGRRNSLSFPRTLQDPADRRAGRRPMLSAIPTAANKECYEKIRGNTRHETHGVLLQEEPAV